METSEINSLIHQRLVHEVHTSERKSFRGCRRRWNWIFQDFYYPQTTAKPLEFGVAFHNAMETLYDPTTWHWTRNPQGREVIKNSAIDVFINSCQEQKAKYLRSTSRELDDEADEDYAERIELGKGMINYFWTEVAPNWDRNFKPISVEQEFIVPIQNPDDDSYLFCKCKRCQKTMQEYLDSIRTPDAPNGDFTLTHNDDKSEWWWTSAWTGIEGFNNPTEVNEWDGLPVCLAGRLDLLMEDNYGGYWIVDWKTTARLARGDSSGQERDEFLELDDQIGSYVMALRRKLGLNVKGFIYVEIKKAFPESPIRNSTVRLGRMYSVNKNQAVDYNTYVKCIKENDTEAYEAGAYDDFLNYLQNDGINFTGRYQIVKSDEELEEIERGLWAEAADMTDPNLRIYASPGRFSCGFCAFRQPCLEKFRKGDWQFLLDNSVYDKRDKHYWVKELSTEKQGGE